jgi:hypothetical protein
VVVEDGGDIVSLIFESAGHVGAHTTDSYECDGFFHKFLILRGFLDRINRIEKNNLNGFGKRKTTIPEFIKLPAKAFR